MKNLKFYLSVIILLSLNKIFAGNFSIKLINKSEEDLCWFEHLEDKNTSHVYKAQKCNFLENNKEINIIIDDSTYEISIFKMNRKNELVPDLNIYPKVYKLKKNKPKVLTIIKEINVLTYEEEEENSVCNCF